MLVMNVTIFNHAVLNIIHLCWLGDVILRRKIRNIIDFDMSNLHEIYIGNFTQTSEWNIYSLLFVFVLVNINI